MTSAKKRPLLARLIAVYLKLCWITGRKTFEGRALLDEAARRQMRDGKPVIICFWHGRLAFAPFFTRENHSTYTMISRHKDGQLIADVCRIFGLKAVRGSSNRSAKHHKGAKNRGGARALAEAVNYLEKGHNIAITPDGPKGPRMRFQEGAVFLAERGKADVLLATYSTSCGLFCSSWDRFLLPLPFGRIHVRIEGPFRLERATESAREKAGKTWEDALNRMTAEADLTAGRKPVFPE